MSVRVHPSAAEALKDLIEHLDPAEQQTLLEHVSRAKIHGGRIDDFSLVHESLKARVEDIIESRFKEISEAKAPPVIKEYPDAPQIELPRDFIELPHAIDRVIRARASRRDFSNEPISIQELSSLFHYTYGVRRYQPAYNAREFPFRFSPSSGGLQAVEIYAVINSVEGVEKGLYHYNAARHSLEQLELGNMRYRIVNCSLFQGWLQHAGVVLLLTNVMERVRWKYGARGYRYIHIDLGCLTQSLYLVTTALKLRCCAVAAYLDDAVNELLRIDGRDEFVSLLMGLGKRPESDIGYYGREPDPVT